MNLLDYWLVLRRSWALILVSTLVGLGLGIASSMAATKIYRADAQLFVSVKDLGQVGEAYSGGMFVRNRVSSYLGIIDTPAVLDPVIQELGLPGTYASLAGKVSATSPTNTVLLDATVTDTNPEQAAKIANAVAASWAKEISRLEGGDPTTTGDTTTANALPVQATVIKPAEVPRRPISPRPRNNMMIGLLLGLLVGTALAVLRHVLDTSIKTEQEIEEITGATSLGALSYDPEAATQPLVTLRGSARSEAFRTVRTNLQYVDVDNPPQVVVITSSVPSEGKSTTACNLAIAVAQGGSKVMLIEADLRKPKVSEYLQVDGSRGITDVLVGQLALDSAIVHWQRGLLDFLPAGSIPPNPSELLGSKHMANLLTELRRRYDVVIIDAPPLLPVTDAAVLGTVVDGAIIVVRHEKTRREQLEDSVDALAQVNARLLGTIMNFVPIKKRRKYGYGGYGYGEEGYGYGYGGYGYGYGGYGYGYGGYGYGGYGGYGYGSKQKARKKKKKGEDQAGDTGAPVQQPGQQPVQQPGYPPNGGVPVGAPGPGNGSAPMNGQRPGYPAQPPQSYPARMPGAPAGQAGPVTVPPPTGGNPPASR